MQWDQFAVRTQEDRIQPGQVLRRHTERRDTLTALNRDPESLEMSDLKLLTVPGDKPAVATTSDDAIPYPFDRIRVGSPLALSFQIYHLGSDDEERTHYTVSYKVRRSGKDGGFLGLFGGGDSEETTTTSTYRGESQRTNEYILLDLDDFAGDESETVEVTVSVSDKVTGQQMSRSISFETIVQGR